MFRKICAGLIALGLTTQAFAGYQMTPRQAFYYHAHKGNLSALQKLKSMGHSINMSDQYGNSALCESVYRQDYSAFAMLKQVGATTAHPCVSKIPQQTVQQFNQGYANWAQAVNSGKIAYAGASAQTATGTATATGATTGATTATVATTTGLSTAAMVGIGVGAAALIGGGVALAAGGGGGGGGSSAPAVCSGRGSKNADDECICNAGWIGDNCENKNSACTGSTTSISNCSSQTTCKYGDQTLYTCTTCNAGYTGEKCNTCASGYDKYGTNSCHATLACEHGTQSGATCSCDTGYAGTLCTECASGYDLYGTTTCHKTLACVNGTQAGDSCVCSSDLFTGTLCDKCISGYDFYGTTSCHATKGCVDGTQVGDTCQCNGNAGGELCDACKSGYDFYETTTCHATLSCGANKHQVGDNCVCNDSHPYEYEGTCYAPIAGGCGENEMQQGNTCVCLPDYEKIAGVCTLTTCPANTYRNGDLCVACPANSTSPAGSTSIDDCTCASGYKKAGDFCVPNTQSGKIFKLGMDTHSSTHVIDSTEVISITKYNSYDDNKDKEGDAAIEMFNGATLVNNGTITAPVIGNNEFYQDGFERGFTAIDSWVDFLHPDIINYVTNNGTINGKITLTQTIFENSETGTINYDASETFNDDCIYNYSSRRNAIETGSTVTSSVKNIFLNKGQINVTNGDGIIADLQTDIYNYGNINMFYDVNNVKIDGLISGVALSTGGNLVNYGNITSSKIGISAGIDELEENQELKEIQNNGTITQYNDFVLPYGTGIRAHNVIVRNRNTITSSGTAIEATGGKVYNTGTITGNIGIRGVDSEIVNTGRIEAAYIGIEGENSIIENSGEIIVDKDGVGIWARGGTVYNTGTISVGDEGKTASEVVAINFTPLPEPAIYYTKGTLYGSTGLIGNLGDLYVIPDHYEISEGGEYKTGVYFERTGSGTQEDPYVLSDYYAMGSGYIWLENGATLATSGTIDAGTSSLNTMSMSPDGTGKLVLQPKAKLASQKSVVGPAYLATDFVMNNSDTTVVAKDMIQTPDASKLNLISQSALFDAKLADNGSDVIMQMKSFNTTTQNASLAQFLTTNYALGNNEAFYNKLKSFGNMSSLTESLNKLTGKDMLSRFNFEDMTMMRELNFDMNEKLFHNKEQHFALAGSVSPMAFKGDTGSDARYSLFNKRDGNTSIGLGVAFTDVRSDDDHNNNSRSETSYQLILPMGYKTHGFNLMTSPRIGYARGTYDRTGFDEKTYDGTIEKRVFGLMNEARYPMTVGKWTFEPAAEFNILGYQQKGREDAKEFALKIQNQNTYSVEGGIGLYATREEELDKDTTLKMTAGVVAYHEFADPYKLRVGMEGMDGAFTLRDENRSDNRGVIRAGFDYTQGDYSLYGSFLSYIDKEWRTNAKTGFKWKF